MNYLQFRFPALAEYKKDVLTAYLDEIGFTGFEEKGNEFTAYIPEGSFDEDSFGAVMKIVTATHTRSLIAEKNWNETWEAGFEPVTVFYPGTDKPFVFLHASFHAAARAATYNIEITPKMSFGTGHHATTALMIGAMSKLDFTGSVVFDFGTGTGVLAILAEKMGAADIVAIDLDDWSIRNAKENIMQNNCEHIEIIQAAAVPPGLQANIILANINLNVILYSLPALFESALPGAMYLFSGILKQDEQTIVHAIEAAQMLVEQKEYKGEWMLICAKKPTG